MRMSPIFDSVWSGRCSTSGNAASSGTNARGRGTTTFNDNTIIQFCRRNNVRIIRGHQVYTEGWKAHHTQLVGSLSSMSHYGTISINGKVVECDGDKIYIRDVVRHPIPITHD
ncbi:hypothetical protein B9Z55_023311 [Caenorhabditis nigoni]|uniref:Serine/threonine specific protein phosphatases domain-containing protein n=1 Tax=Caenorhabditis nigoni TaxID=1611254 RepID=A0A2G5SPL4_9PELO|nr:hypothetical protein B9Z55_023311 [Caenorhabditis nigoni]